MEVIRKIIEHPSRTDTFYLYPLGDIHLGVVHCDEDLLKAKVREIKSNPNAYWLGMGDYGDCITPSDFKRWEGRILATWMRGNEDNIGPAQVEYVDDILSPIWNKCLGLIEGNHDDSIRKFNHYNFMTELLKKANKGIKRPEDYNVRYAGVSCFLQLAFHRVGAGWKEASHGKTGHEIIVHARHGEGAARTSGARALAVLRLAQTFVNANITLMGHLHGQEAPDLPERLILRDGHIKAFDGIATMTGAWLKAYAEGVPPCYLERWGTPPSQLGCPRIVIEPDKQRMTLEKIRQIRTL
ncbi:MAG: hypothetical protein PHY28_04310 [Dehalococcoidales bacterium]|nr:hypothetical protein [Dehalococcoidales bacterium]